MAHVPIRMCIVCKQRYPKKMLRRFVSGEKGPVEDVKGTLPGRGFYVCRDTECELRAREFFKKGFGIRRPVNKGLRKNKGV